MTDRQEPRHPAGPPLPPDDSDLDAEYSAYDDFDSALPAGDVDPSTGAPGAFLDDSDAFEPDLRAEVAAHYETEAPGVPTSLEDVEMAELDLDGDSISVSVEPMADVRPPSDDAEDLRDMAPLAAPVDVEAVPAEAAITEPHAVGPEMPGAEAESEAEAPAGEAGEPEPAESTTATSLAIADADAAADLARVPRMSQYRSQRRRFTSMFITALLLIALGVLYLSVTLTPELGSLPPLVMVGITTTAVALSLIGRFVFNGRRERGLFALGTLILLWTGLLALVVNGNLSVGQGWPLALAAIGAAFLLTFVFERNHERGLLLPGFALIVAGIVAMPFGVGLVPREIMATVALLWPLLLLIPALALIPLAFRIRAE